MLGVKTKIKKIFSIGLIPKAYIKAKDIRRYNKEHKGNVSIIVLCEHLGDIIACEPVSSYLKERFGTKIIWIADEKFSSIITLFKCVDKVVNVNCLSECIYIIHFLSSFKIYNLHFDGRRCRKYALALHNNNKKYSDNNYFNHGSILETFSETGGLPRLKRKPILYLSKLDKFPELKKPYVCIQVESNEMCKTWGIEKWIELLSNNPDVYFVEIGLKPHLNSVPNCNSEYCGKISLIEIAYLINKSIGFVGIDSSMAHYANALNKKSLLLFGKYRNYKYYDPYSIYDDDFVILHSKGFVKDISVETVSYMFCKIFK